jgi:hypothetical protein
MSSGERTPSSSQPQREGQQSAGITNNTDPPEDLMPGSPTSHQAPQDSSNGTNSTASSTGNANARQRTSGSSRTRNSNTDDIQPPFFFSYEADFPLPPEFENLSGDIDISNYPGTPDVMMSPTTYFGQWPGYLSWLIDSPENWYIDDSQAFRDPILDVSFPSPYTGPRPSELHSYSESLHFPELPVVGAPPNLDTRAPSEHNSPLNRHTITSPRVSTGSSTHPSHRSPPLSSFATSTPRSPKEIASHHGEILRPGRRSRETSRQEPTTSAAAFRGSPAKRTPYPITSPTTHLGHGSGNIPKMRGSYHTPTPPFHLNPSKLHRSGSSGYVSAKNTTSPTIRSGRSRGRLPPLKESAHRKTISPRKLDFSQESDASESELAERNSRTTSGAADTNQNHLRHREGGTSLAADFAQSHLESSSGERDTHDLPRTSNYSMSPTTYFGQHLGNISSLIDYGHHPAPNYSMNGVGNMIPTTYFGQRQGNISSLIDHNHHPAPNYSMNGMGSMSPTTYFGQHLGNISSLIDHNHHPASSLELTHPDWGIRESTAYMSPHPRTSPTTYSGPRPSEIPAVTDIDTVSELPHYVVPPYTQSSKRADTGLTCDWDNISHLEEPWAPPGTSTPTSSEGVSLWYGVPRRTPSQHANRYTTRRSGRLVPSHRGGRGSREAGGQKPIPSAGVLVQSKME